MNGTGQRRCAIYTRTAAITGTGDANRINEQRDAALAYVAARAADGWVALPERYDDNGRGGNTADRPALRWLLRDVAAGKVDRVVVQRYDRLARDGGVYADLLATLRRHGVELASATEAFGPDPVMVLDGKEGGQ